MRIKKDLYVRNENLNIRMQRAILGSLKAIYLDPQLLIAHSSMQHRVQVAAHMRRITHEEN